MFEVILWSSWCMSCSVYPCFVIFYLSLNPFPSEESTNVVQPKCWLRLNIADDTEKAACFCELLFCITFESVLNMDRLQRTDHLRLLLDDWPWNNCAANCVLFNAPETIFWKQSLKESAEVKLTIIWAVLFCFLFWSSYEFCDRNAILIFFLLLKNVHYFVLWTELWSL